MRVRALTIYSGGPPSTTAPASTTRRGRDSVGPALWTRFPTIGRCPRRTGRVSSGRSRRRSIARGAAWTESTRPSCCWRDGG